ncbi:MAG: PAS domain-containing protein, partial [Pararhodobacter sp.]|nr:PAS domain-containing protein [Pararhodobacter sp.]
ALMPLADRQGAITRVLGVLETHGQIGRAPRHFRLTAPASVETPAPRPQGAPVLTLIQGGRG